MNARIAISGILGILLVGLMVGFAGRLRARAAYEESRKPLDALVLQRQVYTADTLGFIEEVKETWEQMSSTLPGPYAELMAEHGIEPALANYLRMVSEPLPKFPLLWPFSDGDLWTLVEVKGDTMPMSLDGIAYVSVDATQAMIRFSEGLTILLEEEPEGVRETMFRNAALL